MMCDECKKNMATVHVTQVVNGQKTEMHLCSECAAKKGVMMFNLDMSNFSLPKLFGSFFQGFSAPALGEIMSVDPVCPNCGMHLSRLSQLGRLGCSECYNTFAEQLEPALRRIHGHTRHVGRVPARQGGTIKLQREIESLKAQLKKAVQDEQYEKAAELRDRIKKLEKELG